MKLSTKSVYLSLIAGSLLLQPVQAQAPAQPGVGSAAAADAAEIRQQASDAFARALDAALRCDREEFARQIALLESLNARIAEVSANAAAGRRAARRVPAEFGGAPQGGSDSTEQAENVVRQLLAHARGLVPNCGPEKTATAPPAEDTPTLEAVPLPPGSDLPDKNAEFYFPTPTADNPNPTGWIRARPPETDYELWKRYGHVPIPPQEGAVEGKAPEMGGAQGAGTAAPPGKRDSGPAAPDNQAPDRGNETQHVPPPAPGSGQPKQDASKPSEAAEGAPDQAGQTSAPSPSPRTWPSKTSASDLKARNSETATELMEAPASPMDICREPEAPETECGDQRPPGRKPDQRERRDPR